MITALSLHIADVQPRAQLSNNTTNQRKLLPDPMCCAQQYVGTNSQDNLLKETAGDTEASSQLPAAACRKLWQQECCPTTYISLSGGKCMAH